MTSFVAAVYCGSSGLLWRQVAGQSAAAGDDATSSEVVNQVGLQKAGFQNRYYQAAGFVGSRVLEYNETGRFREYVEVTWCQATSVDGQGRIWIVDRQFHQVLMVEPRTRYIPWAAYYVPYAGMRGVSGHLDGSRKEAKFDGPSGLALAEDADGLVILFVADTNNHCVRRLDWARGRSLTILGSPGKPGLVDGFGGETRFRYPMSMGVDIDASHLFVLDNSRRIRHVNLLVTPAQVTTLVGGACRAVNQFTVYESIITRTVGCHPDWAASDIGEGDVVAEKKDVICIGHMTTCGPRRHPALADKHSKQLNAVPEDLMEGWQARQSDSS